MISGLFIDRPRLAIVASILVVVAGVISILRIPVAQYPPIAPPTVQVSAVYAGANAAVVEESVAQPIEAALRGVEGMKYMTSQSTGDGFYSLTIAFDVGTDPSLAAVDVENAISRIENTLPAPVRQTGITVVTATESLLFVSALYSPDGTIDELFLSNYATLNLVDALSSVDGVGNVQVFGERDYAMRIWLDPARLAALGLTVEDAILAVEAQNQPAAAGGVGLPPAPSGQFEQLTLVAKGRLTTPEEFGDIILSADPVAGMVRLSDVARVALGAASEATATGYDGHPSVAIGIYLSPDANAVTVASAVAAQIERLAARFPAGIAHATVIDGSAFVTSMVDKVVETLLVAFGLVCAVVFLFLGVFRAAIIPLVAAPVALVGAFAVMGLAGISANSVSLLALVLAVGIVVDDAIIVVEHVQKVMSEDPRLSPAAATRRAMADITPSIVAITLVLLAVFVPVAFLPGATGVLFREFAVTISSAVLISAIVALTLSPALAANILRPGKPVLIVRPVTALVNGLGIGYGVLVRLLLRASVLSVAALAAIAVWGGTLLETLPRSYIPAEDKGFLFVAMSLPPGASLERTAAAAALAEPVIEADPAVESAVGIVGVDFVGGGTASNAGVFFVKLKDYAERTAPDLLSFATAYRLDAALAPIAEARFLAVNPPPIDGLGRVGGLELVVKAAEGQGEDALEGVAQHIALAAGQLPETGSVYAGVGAQVPQVRLDIDRDLAQELGISMSEIFTALRVMLGGAYVNDFNLYGRNWTVQMQAEPAARAGVEDALRLHVRTSAGDMVPLSTFVSATTEMGAHTVMRYDNVRAVELTISAAPGAGTSDVIAAIDRLLANELPSGYAASWTGQALEEIEAAGRTETIILLSVLFAFLFLVVLYESWIVPVPVLLSVVVAVAGALQGLAVLGLPFDVYAQIGIVVLIALAGKNAILIASFALKEREDGRPLREAIASAARQRFRPVMMTSIAFICGLVPLALAKGPGAGAMVAVGVPVLAGMLGAALVGILVFPPLLHIAQGLRERLARAPSATRGGHPPEDVPAAGPRAARDAA